MNEDSMKQMDKGHISCHTSKENLFKTFLCLDIRELFKIASQVWNRQKEHKERGNFTATQEKEG